MTKQGQTAELGKFNAVQEAEILPLLNVAEQFIEVQKLHQPYFQISTLANLSDKNNITFVWEHLANGEKITLLGNSSLTFAVRYNEI